MEVTNLDSLKDKMKNRKVLYIGLAIVVVLLFQPFNLFNYGGGWEVSVKATQARVD